MTYQVSRNGQMYGPYTLEDLRRYVASGNMLPTDMAKSAEMADWLPVSQILGGATVPPPVSAPVYAAPAGYAPTAGSLYPDPPDLHWALELVLGLFTCGLFVVVWNLVIATWANRVQPASKALILYIAATVLVLLHLGGGGWGIDDLGHAPPSVHAAPQFHPRSDLYRFVGRSPHRTFHSPRHAGAALQCRRTARPAPQRGDDIFLRRNLFPVQAERDQ